MKDRDEIKELFSKKLGAYEAEVNPQLWGNIASQVAGSTGGSVAGISIFSKVIIGVTLITSVVVAVVLINNNYNNEAGNDTIVEKNINDDAIIEEKSTQQEMPVDNKQPSGVEREGHQEIKQQEPSQDNNEATTTELVPIANNNSLEESNPTAEIPEQNIEEGNNTLHGETGNTASPGISSETDLETNNTNETVVENQTPDLENATYKIDALPNIFSPNNDGENDLFHVKSEGLEEFNIVVLDSKSKVVFQSNNPDFMWNGNDLSGTPVPSGYNVRYVYYITARDKNGQPVNKGSSLRIMR